MKYYTMKECFDACSDDDIPFIKKLDGKNWNGGVMHPKKNLINNEKISLEFALSDRWQIKRAKSKVLTAEEMFNKVERRDWNNGRWNDDNIKFAISESHKNGRLEMYQEFEPLIEELTEILDAGSRVDNDLRWNHIRVHLSNLPEP